MDIEHCDMYETFLKELAFGYGIQGLGNLTKLYEKAMSSVEPLAENVIYTEEEEIQDAMDDCWDNVWINPLTRFHITTQQIKTSQKLIKNENKDINPIKNQNHYCKKVIKGFLIYP